MNDNLIDSILFDKLDKVISEHIKPTIEEIKSGEMESINITCVRVARTLANLQICILQNFKELDKKLDENIEIVNDDKELDLCYNCCKERAKDKTGAFVCPCPHCGNEVPF